jgi:hypothetical protein
MAKYLRTLLLVGLTGALGALSGCIVDTGGRPGPGPGSGSCLANQFIGVQWLIDSGPGTAPMACNATPANSVVLTMASGGVYSVAGSCDDTYHYNWYGETPSGVLAGDFVTAFQLVQTSAPQTVLSAGGTFTGSDAGNPPVPSCQPLQLTYLFGLNM